MARLKGVTGGHAWLGRDKWQGLWHQFQCPGLGHDRWQGLGRDRWPDLGRNRWPGLGPDTWPGLGCGWS